MEEGKRRREDESCRKQEESDQKDGREWIRVEWEERGRDRWEREGTVCVCVQRLTNILG